MIYISSDLHLGHRNIIRYSNRPFKSVQEMDDALISNFNSKVNQNDTVYIVGDFAFGDGLKKVGRYFERLNGKKHLVIGNHDNNKTINLPWESVNSLLEVSVSKKTRLVLCHYAMRVWHHSYRGVYHIHGHSHGTLPENRSLSFDVGVDVWNYYPISIDDIKKKMLFKKEHPEHPLFNSPQLTQEVRNDEEMEQMRKDISELNNRILYDGNY